MQNNIGEARRSYALTVDGFTQKEAARHFGVSESTYKKWEQGLGMLNGLQLCAMADTYGVTTDYLLRRTEAPGGHLAAALPVDPPRAELLHSYARLNDEGRERLIQEAAILNSCGYYTRP